MMNSIPNLLTYLRLGLIPLFVILLIEPSPMMVNLAAVVFVLAALTDYVDGFIARRFGAVSDFGKLLDPLADKILVMAALVMLVAQRSDAYGEPWVSGWIVVLVLAREIWVTGLRGVAASKGRIVSAGGSGKLKSALQMVAILCLLLHDREISFGNLDLSFQILGLNLLLISLAFSYWGAVEYTYLVLVESKEKTAVDHNSVEPTQS